MTTKSSHTFHWALRYWLKQKNTTYEQYTGSLLAESSSLDSSMSGSAIRTHWACRDKTERANTLISLPDPPNVF